MFIQIIFALNSNLPLISFHLCKEDFGKWGEVVGHGGVSRALWASELMVLS